MSLVRDFLAPQGMPSRYNTLKYHIEKYTDPLFYCQVIAAPDRPGIRTAGLKSYMPVAGDRPHPANRTILPFHSTSRSFIFILTDRRLRRSPIIHLIQLPCVKDASSIEGVNR